VLGCPFASIGTELVAPGAKRWRPARCDSGAGARKDLLQSNRRLRDAMADGSIPKGNSPALAKTLYLYI